MRLDPDAPYRFVGCLPVFPVGAVGTFMILDYPGPQGPFGFAEYFGWWALCILVGILTGKLIAAFFEKRPSRWLALLGAIAFPTALTIGFWEDIKPTTPAEVKVAVEISLRAIGMLALAGLVVLATRAWWRSRSAQYTRGLGLMYSTSSVSVNSCTGR
jgi:hypothetical protein